MQLSAANLIIASQQLARGVAKPAADSGAQFAQALAKQPGAKETNAFEAMDFKPAPAKQSTAAPAQAPVTGYGTARALGGNLDIRV